MLEVPLLDEPWPEGWVGGWWGLLLAHGAWGAWVAWAFVAFRDDPTATEAMYLVIGVYVVVTLVLVGRYVQLRRCDKRAAP